MQSKTDPNFRPPLKALRKRGIALAGIFTAINVLILNMYQGGERDRVMGWRGSAQSFGGVIWPLIGGALGGFSWHLPFAVYMLAIPIGLLAMAIVPEPATHQRKGPPSVNGTSVFTVFRQNPVLLIIYGLMFFANVLLYVIVIFLPQLLETFGISSTFRIGLFLTAMTGAAGATAFIYGKIRSRFSRPAIVMTAVVIWSDPFTGSTAHKNLSRQKFQRAFGIYCCAHSMSSSTSLA